MRLTSYANPSDWAGNETLNSDSVFLNRSLKFFKKREEKKRREEKIKPK
jgi:hypothetical protein